MVIKAKAIIADCYARNDPPRAVRIEALDPEDGVWKRCGILRQRPGPNEEGEPFSDVRFVDGREVTVKTIGELRTKLDE
jgi:hypothetical protein